jgi:aminoglycoside phosphotransferase (APT) family kinase protein
VVNVEIDESLVRSLLRAQHPDLAGLSLRQIDAGWDNQLWRLGDDLAVRMPRTTRAPTLLRKEHQWLPVLAPRLPLPVPTPVRIGRRSAHFPQPWTVATWVPGDPADRTSISRCDDAADRLAGFLRALHKTAPADAPDSPNRGVPLGSLTDEFERKFRATTVDSDAVANPAILREIWHDAVAAPTWEGPPFWLHGDLHPANVVISDGTLSGVIDFGELCAGDPATDLAGAWLLLPTGGVPRFFDAYGQVDDATIRRAKGWAVLRGISLVAIGQAWERGRPGGQPTWGAAGRAALNRVLAAG